MGVRQVRDAGRHSARGGTDRQCGSPVDVVLGGRRGRGGRVDHLLRQITSCLPVRVPCARAHLQPALSVRAIPLEHPAAGDLAAERPTGVMGHHVLECAEGWVRHRRKASCSRDVGGTVGVCLSKVTASEDVVALRGRGRWWVGRACVCDCSGLTGLGVQVGAKDLRGGASSVMRGPGAPPRYAHTYRLRRGGKGNVHKVPCGRVGWRALRREVVSYGVPEDLVWQATRHSQVQEGPVALVRASRANIDKHWEGVILD